MNIENLSVMDALMICVLGFLTVFVVLSVISLILQFVSKMMNQNKTKVKEEPITVNQVEKTPTDDNHETLILITAAVAAYLQTSSSNFIVREYRKIDQSSNWKNSARFNQIS